MSEPVEIKVLGSLQLSVGQRPVVIPPGHQRALLSSLLLAEASQCWPVRWLDSSGVTGIR